MKIRIFTFKKECFAWDNTSKFIYIYIQSIILLVFNHATSQITRGRGGVGFTNRNRGLTGRKTPNYLLTHYLRR